MHPRRLMGASGRPLNFTVRAHMRVLLAFLGLAPLVCAAADRLNGTWHSDHDASMRFVRSHAILEPRQLEFLDGSLGRLELSFDGSHLRYLLPSFDVTIQGKQRHLVASDDSFSYRVLGVDSDSVALLVTKYYGRDRIIHIHFVDDDSFWLYSEESDFGLRDQNFREYFRRSK
jgi:hypothetical protein